MKSLSDFQFDGQLVLEELLRDSGYKSLFQAIASLSVFSHRDTVSQTNNIGVFPVIRCQSPSQRGKFQTLPSGQTVMLDDNKAPTDAFIWAHKWRSRQYKDIQFNHLWPSSGDPKNYTSLANICVLPAFLSKLSDTHPEVRQLLQYRAYELYGYWPDASAPLERPQAYGKLSWSETLPVTSNLERRYREAMKTKPRNRTTRCVVEAGWYFNDFKPNREFLI